MNQAMMPVYMVVIGSTIVPVQHIGGSLLNGLSSSKPLPAKMDWPPPDFQAYHARPVQGCQNQKELPGPHDNSVGEQLGLPRYHEHMPLKLHGSYTGLQFVQWQSVIWLS